MSWERKVARRVAVMNHARNLARSGRYDGWEAIRADMQAVSDLSDAERWFSDPAFRAQLTHLCQWLEKDTPGQEAQEAGGFRRPGLRRGPR